MNNKLYPLILLTIVLTCCSTAQSDTVTLEWTAPTYMSIAGESCDPDSSWSIRQDETRDMRIEIRNTADPDTAWAELVTIESWLPGGEYRHETNEIAAGVWLFRVSCFGPLTSSPCWSNIVERVIENRHPAAVVDLHEVE